MAAQDVSRTARQVAGLLTSSPSWLDFKDDKETFAKLQRCLQRISAFHTDVIRGGIEFFIHECKRKKKYSTPEQSKLYLLNRYLFRLPRWVARGEFRFFGGWFVPEDEEGFDPNWPFAVGKGGRPILKDRFGGYMGDEFLALAEFDFFKTRYPRRKGATRK